MPLWLQGAFESAQAALLSAVLVVLPLVAVWWADGFKDRTPDALAQLAGQAWLIIHAVPLTLVAGMGHLFLGSVDLPLLLSLLLGSIPGIILGSYFSVRMPEAVLRLLLATILVIVGGRLVF